VILAALRDAREKAQVNSFLSQIKQVQNALELYRNDTGTYPQIYITQSLSSLISGSLSSYISPIQYPSFITSVDYISFPQSSPFLDSINRQRCGTGTATSSTYIIRILKPTNGIVLPLTQFTTVGSGLELAGVVPYVCVTI
jgi:hypothetical protein